MTAPDPATTGTGPLQAGAVVGRYRLLGPLGEGGMGVVYRAEDTTLGRHAALKFLPVHLAASGEAAARLLAEARAASALDHRHICTIYEVGEAEDGRFFIAMACYDGQSLADRLKEGPVSVEEAVRIATETACALEAAHAKGIIHRDIKPSNIFLTADGTVKLLDFGVAKMDGEALTRTGDTLGTIQYMAPEQTRGVADVRGDLWSLGAVLYEMIVGERLFGASYDGALLFDILYSDVDLEPARRAGAPDSVVAIIAQCLQREPGQRVASATVLREELEAAFEPGAPDQIPDVPPAPRGPDAFQTPTVAAPPPGPTDAGPADAGAVDGGAQPSPSQDTAPIGAVSASPLPLTAAGVAPVATAPVAPPTRRIAPPPKPLLALVLLAVVGGGAWALWGGSEAADEGPEATELAVIDAGTTTAGGGAVADSSEAAAPDEASAPREPAAEELTAPPAASPVQPPPRVVYQAPPPQPATRQAPPPAPRQAAPPPAPATLISRVPAGVTVSVDGRPVSGSTTVEAGTHTVVFRHPRYGETRRTVRVRAGESAALAIHFEAEVRVGARLASGAGPAPFAAVWVDGRNTGAFTPTTLTLGPGRHSIELRREGYTSPDSPQTVTVEPSDRPITQSVSFRLAPNVP